MSGQSSRSTSLTGADVRLEGKIADHRVQATAYYSAEFDQRWDEAAGRPPFRAGLRDTSFRGLQIQDAWTPWERFSLIAGADFERVESESKTYAASGARARTSTPTDGRETLGVFTDVTGKFLDGKLTLNAGARHDRIELQLKATHLRPDVVPGTTTLTTTNPRAGFVFNVANSWRLHGTAGRGFVSPQSLQLAGFFDETVSGQRRITRGNPALSPESAWTYDLGVGFERSWLAIDVTGFQTRVADKIESVFVLNTPALRESTYQNASTARSSGLEVDFAADVGTWWSAPQGRWRLTGSYTHLIDREQTLPAGRSVLRNVARDKINTALSHQRGRLSLRLNFRHVRGMQDQDFSRLLVFTGGRGGLFEYPSISLFDLHASWRLNDRQTVSVAVDNVFDRFYYEKNDYPLAGRAFTARYRVQF
jgi:outer membrane receptor protein involved in Fe transport